MNELMMCDFKVTPRVSLKGLLIVDVVDFKVGLKCETWETVCVGNVPCTSFVVQGLIMFVLAN